MHSDSVSSLLDMMRHSCAHLMAAAIHKLYPVAKFGVGPTVENGFYYDVLFPTPIAEADLQKIQQEMTRLRKAQLPFVRKEVPIDDAIRAMQAEGQEFKVELLQLLKQRGSTAVQTDIGDDRLFDAQSSTEMVSFYHVGDFFDLCRGPHVASTGAIGPFKLTNVAGAYWRGDERRPQLQRIYGICFNTEEELDHCLWQIEQARLRDHRRLGAQLRIFTTSDEVGSGLPLWQPNGVVLRDELAFLAMQEERREGYSRVITPVITKERLYYRSRHLPYYKEDMYAPLDIEGEKYYLRPMNCPHHHELYLAEQHSYRDLPVRLAEYGTVYRYEASGALSGIMRSRGFTQNDAHIYCRYDQAKDEFIRVMRLHARYYDLFDIREYYMRLSLPDLNKLDKYVDQPDRWLAALAVIRAAMDEVGYRYVEVEGEAAFYGPKIDFMIKSAIGNEYAISTNQLDFLAAETFGLSYVGEDGESHPVYVIHRAPLGSHERFIAFLLEHYAGNFPVWLSPIQARVIPITDGHIAYASHVQQTLFNRPVVNGTGGLRVDVDDARERMQKKIRNAQLLKIPYMLVVGDKERDTETVAVRRRSGEDLGAIALEAFAQQLANEAVSRTGSAEWRDSSSASS